MKKYFGIITLTLMVFSIVPQIMAQDVARMEQIRIQMEQVQADMAAGRITPQQAVSRIEQLNAEFAAASQAGTNVGTVLNEERLKVLYDQYKQVQADQHDGRINDTQARQRADQIQSEINSMTANMARTRENELILQRVEEHTARIWPGAQPGWPTAQEWNRIFENQGRYGPFTQSRGTKASFTIDGNGINIFQTGGNLDVVFREWKSQVERITRGNVIRVYMDNNNEYGVYLPSPRNERYGYITYIRGGKNDNGGVNFRIGDVSDAVLQD